MRPPQHGPTLITEADSIHLMVQPALVAVGLAGWAQAAASARPIGSPVRIPGHRLPHLKPQAEPADSGRDLRLLSYPRWGCSCHNLPH